MAHPAKAGKVTVALRDGRKVTVGLIAASDVAEVERLVNAAGDPRAAFFAQVTEQRDGTMTGAEYVARASDGGRIVGYAAYLVQDGSAGELAGAVDPEYWDVGLGTLLLRRAAQDASAAGLTTLRVELHPGTESTAAMLRDAGLASSWDLDYPVTQVQLALGTSRPGWKTPESSADATASSG